MSFTVEPISIIVSIVMIDIVEYLNSKKMRMFLMDLIDG